MQLSRAVVAEKGVVASEQPLASMAGCDALRAGGNAFDAAVATSFALAVTFHPAGGLGGDFFGMFYEARTGKVHCLNSSGWAPSGLTRELVASKGGVQTYGPLACTVPGLVAGVWSMHARLGSLPFRGLLGQAVEYSSNGFPAGEGICRSTKAALPGLPVEARAIFAPRGEPPAPGDWIRQAALGKVLKEVASGGPDAFYKGWPAERIAEALSDAGVPTTLEDFDFAPEWVEPLKLDYRGTTVYEVPPNSMGATSLLMLKMLLETDVSRVAPLSRERIEVTMKAAEVAYERKSRVLGDPRFSAIDLEGFMLPPAGPGHGAQTVKSGDTTAFSVVDAEGNIASGIQSLFHHFGSRIFVPETGLFLNNRGAGFALDGPNGVRPRKRPLHTLSSLVLERDGRPYLGIGASGGEYRPMQHCLFVTNIVDYSMPLEQAIDHPRFLWNGGRSLTVESGYQTGGLEGYDPDIQQYPARTGVCQGVQTAPRFRKGVCDVRGDGVPAGF